MTYDFFTDVWEALNERQKEQKIAYVALIVSRLKSDAYTFDSDAPVLTQKTPSSAAYCHFVDVKETPKRRNLCDKTERATFVHALAHIEYSAIDLALDACYTFRHLPQSFYVDWIEVADDECRHFLLLESLLHECGGNYGDFSVHTSLFDACRKADSLLSRMAVIPRYLEANGLDSNKRMMEKLRGAGTPGTKSIISALECILREEITHVQKGDKWFTYACEQLGYGKEVYFDVVSQTLEGALKPKRNVNIQDRLLAGFSPAEISRLTQTEPKQ